MSFQAHVFPTNLLEVSSPLTGHHAEAEILVAEIGKDPSNTHKYPGTALVWLNKATDPFTHHHTLQEKCLSFPLCLINTGRDAFLLTSTGDEF